MPDEVQTPAEMAQEIIGLIAAGTYKSPAAVVRARPDLAPGKRYLDALNEPKSSKPRGGGARPLDELRSTG